MVSAKHFKHDAHIPSLGRRRPIGRRLLGCQRPHPTYMRDRGMGQVAMGRGQDVRGRGQAVKGQSHSRCLANRSLHCLLMPTARLARTRVSQPPHPHHTKHPTQHNLRVRGDSRLYELNTNAPCVFDTDGRTHLKQHSPVSAPLSTQCAAVTIQFSSIAAPPQRGNEPPSITIQGYLPACSMVAHQHCSIEFTPGMRKQSAAQTHEQRIVLTSVLIPPIMRRSLCSKPPPKCLCGLNPAPAQPAINPKSQIARCRRSSM